MISKKKLYTTQAGCSIKIISTRCRDYLLFPVKAEITYPTGFKTITYYTPEGRLFLDIPTAYDLIEVGDKPTLLEHIRRYFNGL